jgi:hypothetical protein
MPKNCLKSNHVFKLHVDVMLEKFVQTQVREIPSHLQIVVTSIISSCSNAMFLTPSRTVLPGTLPRCFHLSTFLSFFPSLCAVVKNSDCEKYPLVALGQWELKRVCIDVLDFGRSPMLPFFFLFKKWKICFRQNECRQEFLILDILLQILYTTESRQYKLIFNY